MSNNYDRDIQSINAKIQAMKPQPVRNFFKLRTLRRDLQAFEGQRSSALVAETTTPGTNVAKNNYQTYDSQIDQLYKMYGATCDYGGEITQGIIGTRVAFIGGEGLSVSATKPTTEKWINDFIESNRLTGTGLIEMIKIGEMEGKHAATLEIGDNPIKKLTSPKNMVLLDSFLYFGSKYKVEKSNGTYKISYTDENDRQKTLDVKKSVYTKLGGVPKEYNETTNRILSIITQIENLSRGGYDGRNSAHLFGYPTPTWTFPATASAGVQKGVAEILNGIETNQQKPGRGYAGLAKFTYATPDGGSSQILTNDIVTNMKFVSMQTGIPVHWLAWPELMSNRATADNLMEVVIAATKLERAAWEEAFTEIITKAMTMAVDGAGESKNILGEFEIKLPFVSLALLKQIIEIWEPLRVSGVIDTEHMRSILPGINPSKMKARVDAEKAEAAENEVIPEDDEEEIEDENTR